MTKTQLSLLLAALNNFTIVSILTGFLAAKNILGEKHDVFSVNIEKEYHETL